MPPCGLNEVLDRKFRPTSNVREKSLSEGRRCHHENHVRKNDSQRGSSKGERSFFFAGTPLRQRSRLPRFAMVLCAKQGGGSPWENRPWTVLAQAGVSPERLPRGLGPCRNRVGGLTFAAARPAGKRLFAARHRVFLGSPSGRAGPFAFKLSFPPGLFWSLETFRSPRCKPIPSSGRSFVPLTIPIGAERRPVFFFFPS